MARRGLSSSELKKKRDKLSLKINKTSAGETLNTSVRNKNLSKNNSGNTSGVSTKTKQGKKRTPAQIAAAKRLAAKKAGTYKKPKTAQELAKARLKKKKK
tara:strand:+ start:299 stop:598 length:300 start_codon:yes stop_codon:yes gene_type:complete